MGFTDCFRLACVLMVQLMVLLILSSVHGFEWRTIKLFTEDLQSLGEAALQHSPTAALREEGWNERRREGEVKVIKWM